MCSVLISYRGCSRKPPGGWGFYSPISNEASQNKNPTKKLKIQYFLEIRLKRRLDDNSDQELGRSNIQRTITKMFNKCSSKTEFTGVQLVFPLITPYGIPVLQPQIPSSSRFGKSHVHAWTPWRHFVPKVSDRCISPIKGGSTLIFTDWVQESIGYW